MTRNLWTAHAAALAEAYARDAGTVRFELVTRALAGHMAPGPQRVVDVGGGFGRQAILLARAGHAVVVVDCDPNMLAIARDKLAAEPEAVRARLTLVEGAGEEAAGLVGSGFDLACCHSVLMYLDDPAPMLRALVALVRRGGLISVVSTNAEARAMRCGLQGRWREAAASLAAGTQIDARCLPSREHARADVARILEAAGAKTVAWYGVGVFTDHLVGEIAVDDPAEIYLAEWLAGARDPYRRIARCFHLIAERA